VGTKRKTHCLRGHERTPENVTPKGSCKKCRYERAKVWVKEHPERAKAYGKKWRDENKEQDRERKKKYREEDPERFRNNTIRSRYGIEAEDVEQIVESQNNSCAICLKVFESRNDRRIDHCHITGKVRGILCHKCNSALGYFGEDTKNLSRAIVYLEKSREKD
jgi:hypothetical protein